MGSTSFNTEEIEMSAPRAPRKVPPKDETKEAKFIRVANLKVSRLVRAIDGLGNLARLQPSVAQRDYIFNIIKDRVEASHARWMGEKPAPTFQIPTK